MPTLNEHKLFRRVLVATSDGEKAVEMYRLGHSSHEIGKAFDVEPSVVRDFLLKMGVAMRPKGFPWRYRKKATYARN